MSDTILDFAGTDRNMLYEYSILPEHAFNMDQTAVFLDSSPMKTINEKGSKSIYIRSSSGVNGRVLQPSSESCSSPGRFCGAVLSVSCVSRQVEQ